MTTSPSHLWGPPPERRWPQPFHSHPSMPIVKWSDEIPALTLTASIATSEPSPVME
jgi:hypothetical protein